MGSVTLIEHKGKKIAFLDFAGCGAKEMEKLVPEAKALIGSQAPGSVRTLTDVTNTDINKATSAFMKDLTTFNKAYVIAAGVVGVEGLRKVIYNTIVAISGRNMQTFDTLAAAKDWLATQ